MKKFIASLVCLLIVEALVFYFVLKSFYGFSLDGAPFILCAFIVPGLVIYLLWYFLFWKPVKRKNEISETGKTIVSLLNLLISLMLTLFISFLLFLFAAAIYQYSYRFIPPQHEDYCLSEKCHYQTLEVRLYENGDTVECHPSYKDETEETTENALYKVLGYELVRNQNDKISVVLSRNGDHIRYEKYNPTEMMDSVPEIIEGDCKVFRKSDNVIKINSFDESGYVEVLDGDHSNVYGPDAKPVFEKDLTGGLSLYDSGDGLIIRDHNSDVYYDKNGNQVNKVRTFIDKHFKAIIWSWTALCVLVAFMLWHKYSWRRRKK